MARAETDEARVQRAATAYVLGQLADRRAIAAAGDEPDEDEDEDEDDDDDLEDLEDDDDELVDDDDAL